VTAQPEGKPVILTAAEAAFIKETLYRCYATLDRACFASRPPGRRRRTPPGPPPGSTSS
jgi:hypothetical protein